MEQLSKEFLKHNADQMSEDSHFETGPWHEIWEVRNKKYHHMPYELVLERKMNREDSEALEVANERQELLNNYQ